MLENNKVFTNDLYKNHYLEYDITNRAEMITMGIITFFDFALFYLSIKNFYKISQWCVLCPQASPRKLICINSIMLLLIGTRQVMHYYAIFGSMFSCFYINSIESEYVYFNVFIYSYGISMQSHLQNLTIFVSSKLWVKMILIKYIQQKEPIDLKLFRHFISLGSFITIFSLIFLGIYNLIPGIQNEINKMMQYSTLITTLMSAIVFTLSAKLFYSNLNQLNNQQIQDHSKQVKLTCFFLGFFQLIRVVFTIIAMVNIHLAEDFKKGNYNSKVDYYTDSNYAWPIFQFFYILATDFLPALVLLLLFQPQFKKKELSGSENFYD